MKKHNPNESIIIDAQTHEIVSVEDTNTQQQTQSGFTNQGFFASGQAKLRKIPLWIKIIFGVFIVFFLLIFLIVLLIKKTISAIVGLFRSQSSK